MGYSRRLFLWLVAYSLLLVGLVVVFQYNREKQIKAEELNARLQMVNSWIITRLGEGIQPVDILAEASSERACGIFPDFRNMRLSVLDNRGDIIYDNSAGELSENHLDRNEVAEALALGEGFTTRRHSETTGDTYFYSATLAPDGRIVRTAVPYSMSLSQLLSADYGFLWTLGAITLVMCGIGYVATLRLGRNISRLSEFAAAAERGDPIAGCEPFPHDELGDISSHIVRLYIRLQKALADRDREHASALREQHEKQLIKRELTNNINHELKTPVASIRICLETILHHPELDHKSRNKFLERSMANCLRLQRLLSDVASLTRLEDGSANIHFERVDLSEIIYEVVDELSPRAGSIGMRIDVKIPPHLYLEANRNLMESVFHNLIDNAMNYSGGSKITIRSHSESSRRITLTLADDGCGVAEEHLPRLFERFYRVDKGRSRSLGGTGLGLAIVRNALALHGGSITVGNLRHGGLIFRISIPTEKTMPPASG